MDILTNFIRINNTLMDKFRGTLKNCIKQNMTDCCDNLFYYILFCFLFINKNLQTSKKINYLNDKNAPIKKFGKVRRVIGFGFLFPTFHEENFNELFKTIQ